MKTIYIISLIFCLASLHIGQERLEADAQPKELIMNSFGVINGWQCYQEFNETIYEKDFPDDSLDDCQWILKAKKGDTIISFWGSCKSLSVEYQSQNAPFIIFSDPLLPHFGNLLFVVRFDVDGPKLLFMTPFSWDVPFYYTFVDDGSTEGDLRGTLFAKGINYVVNGKTEGVIGEFQEWLCWDLSEETISNPVSRPYPYPPHEKQ